MQVNDIMYIVNLDVGLHQVNMIKYKLENDILIVYLWKQSK